MGVYISMCVYIHRVRDIQDIYVRTYIHISILMSVYISMGAHMHTHMCVAGWLAMGWLRLVGTLKLWVSFAKESYKRDDILQKRPIILRSLLIVATP